MRKNFRLFRSPDDYNSRDSYNRKGISAKVWRRTKRKRRGDRVNRFTREIKESWVIVGGRPASEKEFASRKVSSWKFVVREK